MPYEYSMHCFIGLDLQDGSAPRIIQENIETSSTACQTGSLVFEHFICDGLMRTVAMLCRRPYAKEHLCCHNTGFGTGDAQKISSLYRWPRLRFRYRASYNLCEKSRDHGRSSYKLRLWQAWPLNPTISDELEPD